jgi:lysophospholipase L1-like esterase
MRGAADVGINGQTSAQMLARFQTDVLDRKPTTVVILAGTNDILHTQNPTVDSIQKMADMAAHAGIRVIIGEVPPNRNWTDVITDPLQGNAAIETFNAAIVMMANASGYHVADYYDALVLPDGSQNSALFVDGTHPDKAGYNAMWPEVQKWL